MISGGDRGHRGVVIHSGPQGNSTATCVRSGIVSSPGALAVSSPERVRRAHWFPIKAASKGVDRAGSRDQAMRIGVTANVGGDLRRSTVFRRSSRGPPIRRSQSPFGVMRNALCPRGLSGVNTSLRYLWVLNCCFLGCQRPWNVGYGFDSSAVGWRYGERERGLYGDDDETYGGERKRN
jgi:hypothetical protein